MVAAASSPVALQRRVLAAGLVEMVTDRVIRRAELLRITGISAASIYRWVANGTFPAPRRLGPNATGWLESEVVAWLQSREPVELSNSASGGRE